MKIAITGGNGFIGRDVLRLLAKKNIETINLYHKKKSNIKGITNIKFNYKNKNINLFNKIGKPDVFIHLAWDSLDDHFLLNHLSNSKFSYSFIVKLLEQGLKKIFIMGTCFEYGIKKQGCLKENFKTYPSNQYAKAKDDLRKKLFLYLKKKNIDSILTWGRLFYIYGKSQNSNTLYGQFLKAAKSKAKIFNMSPGDQMRDYLHVHEVAKYILMLSIYNKQSDVFNICSGKPKKLQKIVLDWKKECNSKIDLNLGYYNYSPKEPLHFWGSNKKLKKIIKKNIYNEF